MSIKYKYWYLLLFFSIASLAQNTEKIDSLQKALKKAKEKQKAEISIQIAQELVYDNYAEAIKHAEIGLEQAQKFQQTALVAEAYFTLGKANFENKEYTQAKGYFTLSQENYLKVEDNTGVAQVKFYFGYIEEDIGAFKDAIPFHKEAYELLKNTQENHLIDQALSNMAYSYYYMSDYKNSKNSFEKAYENALAFKDTINMARALNGLGITSSALSNYAKAIEYYIEALRINEVQNNESRIAANTQNVANVYIAMGNYDEAIEYYEKALAIFEKAQDKRKMSTILHNLGIAHEGKVSNFLEADTIPSNEKLKAVEKALNYFNESLQIRIELQAEDKIALSHSSLGSIYKAVHSFNKAMSHFETALEIANRKGNMKLAATIMNELGDIQLKLNNRKKALHYIEKSLAISQELDNKASISTNYKSLYAIYKSQKNYKKALEFYEEQMNIDNSIMNERSEKIIQEMQAKYESDKKEQEIAILNKDKELAEAKSKRDYIIKIVFSIGLVIVLIFLSFAIRQIIVIRKKNRLLAEQKEEIETQRDEISKQRDVVAKQKEEITDSIFYASRIQNAVLPSRNLLDSILSEYFVLFRPRDIVSGDFFWATEKNGKVITVAADCTGHGVPGAFMSMLGVSFLNEIVNKPTVQTAGEILTELRHYVKSTLGQTGKEGEAKDGMDIALCIFDKHNMKLEYAGAYNPLYLFRNGELLETKADKMPIGIYIKEKEQFTTNQIDLERGDTFYIFSDGFVDQFGGARGKKFMAKPFKQLLAKIQNEKMKDQHEILNKTIDDWRGEIEQIDDIIVFGVKI